MVQRAQTDQRHLLTVRLFTCWVTNLIGVGGGGGDVMLRKGGRGSGGAAGEGAARCRDRKEVRYRQEDLHPHSYASFSTSDSGALLWTVVCRIFGIGSTAVGRSLKPAALLRCAVHDHSTTFVAGLTCLSVIYVFGS